MSDTVMLPSTSSSRRRKETFIPPLLIVVFVLYNIFAFTMFGGRPAGWSDPLFTIGMVSGASWGITWGDLMIVVGLILLFFEILKSTQTGRSSVLEHMLSMVVLVLFLVEFLLVKEAATSVFFILMVMSLIDVMAGFTVSITGAGRDVTMVG